MNNLLKALILSIFFQLSVNAQIPDMNKYLNDIKGVDYEDAIQWTIDKGITKGLNETTWAPDKCVTRAEMIKMVLEYRWGNEELLQIPTSPFSDVTIGDWFYDYVNTASYRGVIQGYSDGTFRPNQCVNRVEAMKVAVEAIVYSDLTKNYSAPLFFDDKNIVDMSGNDWYSDYAKTMFSNRLVGTNHTRFVESEFSNSRQIQFFPDADMSRKEVAKMLFEIDKMIDIQMRNGETYTNRDYKFNVTFPSTWGDISVDYIGGKPSTFHPAVLDVFKITSEEKNMNNVFMYVVDPYYNGNSILKDLDLIYIGSNGEYTIFLEWVYDKSNDLFNNDNFKIRNSEVFKIKPKFNFFDI